MKKVYQRLGFSDLILEKDSDVQVCVIDQHGNVLNVDTYHITYENEDGEECDEDGTPL
jgi:hypothetical protein